jgi:hypothetical protein
VDFRPLRLIHQIVERAIRQARDKVRRNVASPVEPRVGLMTSWYRTTSWYRASFPEPGAAFRRLHATFPERDRAQGAGAWIVSCHPGRLFTRNQAITAMVLAERLAAGFGDDDPFVIGWREELGL